MLGWRENVRDKTCSSKSNMLKTVVRGTRSQFAFDHCIDDIIVVLDLAPVRADEV